MRERLRNASRAFPIPLHMLDVAPMTVLRPDAHVGRKADGTLDCLHYKEPGMYRWWNAALLGLLSAIRVSQDEARGPVL